MFDLLFESRPAPARRLGHSLLSFALHGGLIGGAVVMTHRAPRHPLPLPVAIDVSFPIVTTAPTRTESSRPTGETVVSGPRPLSTQFLTSTSDPGPVEPVALPTSPLAGDPVDLRRLVRSELATGGVITLASDSAERDLPDSLPALLQAVSPTYPEALRAAGVSGRVSLEFVVDSTGRASAESVVIRTSDHPAFSVAAQRAVLDSRYRPARQGGRARAARVRQVVVFEAH